MEFIKFPKFRNDVDRKFIQKAYDKIKGLKDMKYIISEKIHGGNMQVIITADGIERGARNKLISDLKDGYYGEDEVFAQEEYIYLIDKFKTLIGTPYGKATIRQINIYGELFGGNINKGVDYGREKKFKMFTKIRINGNFITPSETSELALSVLGSNAIAYFVPIVKIVDTFEEALAYESKFNSTILGIEDNICEGIVIEPLNEVLYLPNGDIFVIKKKNKEFEEKARKSSKLYSEPKEISKELAEARAEYDLYLVKNRIESVMSKEGVIQESSEIGKYIRLILQDAKEDFLIDNEELFLAVDKNDRKNIFKNTGQIIVPLLSEYL